MSEQYVERYMGIPDTIAFIRSRYGVPITRGMVYRRAATKCFRMVEDKITNARPLIETQSVINYYEQEVGIKPVEPAA